MPSRPQPATLPMRQPLPGVPEAHGWASDIALDGIPAAPGANHPSAALRHCGAPIASSPLTRCPVSCSGHRRVRHVPFPASASRPATPQPAPVLGLPGGTCPRFIHIAPADGRERIEAFAWHAVVPPGPCGRGPLRAPAQHASGLAHSGPRHPPSAVVRAPSCFAGPRLLFPVCCGARACTLAVPGRPPLSLSPLMAGSGDAAPCDHYAVLSGF